MLSTRLPPHILFDLLSFISSRKPANSSRPLSPSPDTRSLDSKAKVASKGRAATKAATNEEELPIKITHRYSSKKVRQAASLSKLAANSKKVVTTEAGCQTEPLPGSDRAPAHDGSGAEETNKAASGGGSTAAEAATSNGEHKGASTEEGAAGLSDDVAAAEAAAAAATLSTVEQARADAAAAAKLLFAKDNMLVWRFHFREAIREHLLLQNGTPLSAKVCSTEDAASLSLVSARILPFMSKVLVNCSGLGSSRFVSHGKRGLAKQLFFRRDVLVPASSPASACRLQSLFPSTKGMPRGVFLRQCRCVFRWTTEVTAHREALRAQSCDCRRSLLSVAEALALLDEAITRGCMRAAMHESTFHKCMRAHLAYVPTHLREDNECMHSDKRLRARRRESDQEGSKHSGTKANIQVDAPEFRRTPVRAHTHINTHVHAQTWTRMRGLARTLTRTSVRTHAVIRETQVDTDATTPRQTYTRARAHARRGFQGRCARMHASLKTFEITAHMQRHAAMPSALSLPYHDLSLCRLTPYLSPLRSTFCLYSECACRTSSPTHLTPLTLPSFVPS
eukprot:4238734-Pleurochrysis_carterae.AAC.3